MLNLLIALIEQSQGKYNEEHEYQGLIEMALLSLEAEYCVKLCSRTEDVEKYLYIVKKVEDNGVCLEDEGTLYTRGHETFIQKQADSVQKSINKKFKDLEDNFESFQESQKAQYEATKD